MGTVNYPNPDYIRTFLNQKNVSDYVRGVGVQWTGMKALPVIHKEYPSYGYMQTENMCGNSENDWSALERTWNAVVHCFNNGVGLICIGIWCSMKLVRVGGTGHKMQWLL
ncbi:hypothetical protein [Phocaeicola dorei]|nr:hypothetical protein [Phocaeicola dorei]